MAVRHRILWLINILYCVAIVHSTLLDINDAESCDLLCKQCNASAVFADDRCECNFSDNNDIEGAECIQRIQREIQAIDLNIISEDSTDEERAVRSILKSRRRLRMETGSCAHPAMSDVETPIIGMINPALSYPANVLYHAASPMVGSIIHPYRHGHGLPLHHTLHRTDSLPGLLHNLLSHHRWSPGYHRPLHHGRSSNVSNHNPLINVLHPATDEYVQPGYIPQYVHGMSDPLITAPNPNSYCTHNANAEQKDEVSTDKTVYSNNAAEQSNNANNIFKQENKTEK